MPEGPSFPISYAVDPLEEDEDEDALVMGRMERKSDELDLIPMVDCVFLLLVFYMITAVLRASEDDRDGKAGRRKKGAMAAVQTADDKTQSSISCRSTRKTASRGRVPLASVSGSPTCCAPR